MQLLDRQSACMHSIGSRDTPAATIGGRTIISPLWREHGRPWTAASNNGGGILARAENRTANSRPGNAQIRPAVYRLATMHGFLITTHPLHNGMRRAWRALTFWGRVTLIWGTFKMTQARVALLRASRGDAWVHEVWKRQHEKSGDVRAELSLSTLSPRDFLCTGTVR
jgi:hypothetical protein